MAATTAKLRRFLATIPFSVPLSLPKRRELKHLHLFHLLFYLFTLKRREQYQTKETSQFHNLPIVTKRAGGFNTGIRGYPQPTSRGDEEDGEEKKVHPRLWCDF